MEEKLINIMKEALETEDITTETDQFNCDNWDSLHHLNLIAEIESEFDVEFEPDEMAKMKSYKVVKEVLASKLS